MGSSSLSACCESHLAQFGKVKEGIMEEMTSKLRSDNKVRGNKEEGKNIKGELTSFAKPQNFKPVAFG